MKKIAPFIWFNDNAEEAMNFYISLFKDSKIVSITRLDNNVPGPKGKQLVGIFELVGEQFMTINGGPNKMLGGSGTNLIYSALRYARGDRSAMGCL